MSSYWNIDDIETVDLETADTVLVEQAKHLEDLTKGFLVVKVEERPVPGYFEEYKSCSVLSIYVPSLDNYKYELISVFSNTIPPFPVDFVLNDMNLDD